MDKIPNFILPKVYMSLVLPALFQYSLQYIFTTLQMAYQLEQDITGNIGTQKYFCHITWRNGVLLMDEPTTIEGGDLGIDPYSTLMASLAGCTLSTLRMYINRKGWDIPQIDVRLNFTVNKEGEFSTEIKREIIFPASVTTEQKERLLVIASKCPVSKILENKITINTTA